MNEYYNDLFVFIPRNSEIIFDTTFYWRMEKSPVPLLINKLKLTKKLFPHETSEV